MSLQSKTPNQIDLVDIAFLYPCTHLHKNAHTKNAAPTGRPHYAAAHNHANRVCRIIPSHQSDAA